MTIIDKKKKFFISPNIEVVIEGQLAQVLNAVSLSSNKFYRLDGSDRLYSL